MVIKTNPITFFRDRCKRCGICVELCPQKVFTTTNEGYPEPTNVKKCTRCQLCELWCPDYAIQVEVKE